MKKTLIPLGVFMLVVSAAATRYIFAKGIPAAEVAGAYAAFIILLVPFLGFGFPEIAAAFRKWGGPRPFLLMGAIILAPALALPEWNRVPALLAYGAAVAAACLIANRFSLPPSAWDILVVAAIWIPVEMGFAAGAWKQEGADPSYLLAKTLCVSVGLACYAAIRPLDGLGYRWRLRLGDLGAFAVALAVFLVVAVPAAIASGFVTWDPRPSSLEGVVVRFLAIGLFVALPEEILFRGIIFNLLQKKMVGRYGPAPALLLSSVIFGLSHLNNFPYGDPRYAIIATWAGICYGWAYLRTGNLMAGVLVHTVVDLIHRLILTTPR